MYRSIRLLRSITSFRSLAVAERRHKSTTSSSSPLIQFSHDDDSKIGTITLNSPSTHNALTVEMASEFKSTVQQVKSMISNNDINVQIVILKGAGSNFSAGGDLKWLKALKNNPVHINSDIMYDFYTSYLCIRDIPVPIIASIDGYAIGAGACLALATDLRVMSSTSRIGFNFVKLGIHPGMGGSHYLPIVAGEAKAKEIMLIGDVMTAKEAKEAGIVNRTSTKTGQEFSSEVEDLATQISSHHPLALRSMVRTLRMREDAMHGGLEAALRREAHTQSLCFAKSDWGEGLDAAVERRQPNFDDYSNDWL